MDYTLYKKFGAHIKKIDGTTGVFFSLFAPNAIKISVVGDFNNWNGKNHYMTKNSDTGTWSLFIPHLKEGTVYKYKIADSN
ncbi:MAG: 1,4-alpha-glucan branching enzyme, partial [Cetobacterium sp.]